MADAVPQFEVGVRSDLVELQLLGLPLAEHRATTEHLDELRREFRLLQVQAADREMDHVPARLLRFIASLEERSSGMSEGVEDELDRAEERGATNLDLRYRLPAEARGAAADLDALLDEADAYCRTGDTLLTLQASPEVAAYRRWYLGEIVRQLDGEPPTPWTSR